MVNKKFHYIAVYPVTQDLQKLMKNTHPELLAGKYETTKNMCIRHFGHYKYLGNSWTLAYMYPRSRKMKINTSQMSMEIYVTDPREVPMDESIAEIYVPIK